MSDPVIAWKGELLLAAATWSDKDGHKVKFKIVGGADSPNPFKPFTKRRKGRAGTRFNATFAYVGAGKELVQTDLMLANWTDSSTGGHTVEFWCEPPEQGMHVFEGFERNKDSFMAALVELDDDEEPIDQKARERVEKATKPGRREQRLSQVAAMMCQNPSFWKWAELQGEWQVSNKDEAAEFMRDRLGVETRAMLDRDPGVAHDFHETIRKPFAEWGKEGWAA